MHQSLYTQNGQQVWAAGSNNTLAALCQTYGGAYFSSYENNANGLSNFKNNIKNFVVATQNPVIVYADSQNWGNANIRHNILTVWAVSNTHVRVTKVSNIPSGDFNYNQIISLT